MKFLAIVALAFCIGAVYGGRHSPAEIFNGAYSFVNGSQLLPNGTWIPTGSSARIGNIMYAPAYPGALYGNMSVVYGLVLGNNTTCADALTGFSAYTGPYEVNVTGQYVVHHPIIVSNPVSGHTAQGVPAIRYFKSYEDDNLISVESRPDESFLFWRRDFSFPPVTCTATASVTATNWWVANGVTNTQYVLEVANVGDSTVTSLAVEINLGGTSTITSSWNIEYVEGTLNTYNVDLFGGVATDSTSTFSGFIVEGSGTVYVGVPPSGTVCN